MNGMIASAVFALSAALAPLAVAGENLVKNGDFESGVLKGWTGWSSAGKARVVTDSPYAGKYCFSYEHKAGQKGGWTVYGLNVQTSTVYTLSGQIKGDASNIKITLFFYGPKRKYLGETAIVTSTFVPNWLPFEKAFKTPDTAVHILVGVMVAEGTAYLDDLSVVPGDHAKTVVNEMLNSSFSYSLHENGMPEFWNAGGPLSARSFRPGAHEGRYYRYAPEEKSPVPGTKVIFVDDIAHSDMRIGPLSGNTDYVFSVYMRSDKPDAKVKLRVTGRGKPSPCEQAFTLSSSWQRLVFRFRLEKDTDCFFPMINYERNPVYLAAPMIHAGRDPVAWKPNPADANLPDLRAGRPLDKVAPPAPPKPDAPQKEKPMSIAAERDFYTAGEDTVRVRASFMKEPATLKMSDRAGNPVAERKLSADGKAEFSIRNLPDGYYSITAETSGGKAETHFRKNVSEKHYSRVNRFKRVIEVDGKPFFPMVFTWMASRKSMPTEWHIDELKKRNFNTILLTSETFGTRLRYSPEERRQLMRIFADAGFKFILWTSVDQLKKKGVMAFAEAHEKYLAEIGEDLHKQVIAWYYLDEISPATIPLHGIKKEEIAPGYRADKEMDPGRIHFINWNWTNVVPGSKFFAEEGATDMYSLDSYPYSHTIHFSALANFETSARAIGHRIDDASLPGIMWLQTYSFHEGLREPMPVEYRNNVYAGLVNHVSGYMNFIECPQNGDLWDEMGRAYGTALKWLDMTVQPGARRIAKGRRGNIAYALWKRPDGGYAIVAVNLVYAPQKEKLTFDAKFLPSVKLIGGEGTLQPGTDGSLDISLPVAGSAAWFIGD